MSDERLSTHASALHGETADGSPAIESGVAGPKAESRSRKRRWIGRLIICVVIGAGFGAAIVMFLKFVDGPAVGKADGPTLQSARQSAAPKPQKPNELGGLYVMMNYPPAFDTVGQVKNDSLALEQYVLGSHADYNRSIAVAVRQLPSSNLADDSSYRFRQMNTANYRESGLKLEGEPAALMTKLDGHEQTLFWAHQGKVLTVAITSINPNDDLAGFMQTVTSSVRWRK